MFGAHESGTSGSKLYGCKDPSKRSPKASQKHRNGEIGEILVHIALNRASDYVVHTPASRHSSQAPTRSKLGHPSSE